MTTVITRYFESAATARQARDELIYRRRFSLRIVDLYENADGLADSLAASNVPTDSAKAYEARMADGGAVLVVHAGNKPLAVAKTTREVTAEFGAADMGDLTQEVTLSADTRPTLSIMGDHRHIMTRRPDPLATNYHMADWPIPLISRRKPFTESVIPPHGHMASWPVPLLSDRKPFTGSIFSRHARMANFPIPLLSKRKPFTGSIFARHARMANFPIPLTSRRKPYSGAWIGRHTRMANWPFPSLINGEQGTNALMPGGPRMANFPISLLSKREPFTGSIFARHARMANFPLPLTSRRKPFTGSIFPKHARMADMFLPLVIRREDMRNDNDRKGFSLSRMFGMPTVIRR